MNRQATRTQITKCCWSTKRGGRRAGPPWPGWRTPGIAGHTRGMNRARWTVSVLGAGHVGAAVANALVLLRVCDRVVLYERDPAVA